MAHDDCNSNTYETGAGRLCELKASYMSGLHSEFQAILRDIVAISKIENRKEWKRKRNKIKFKVILILCTSLTNELEQPLVFCGPLSVLYCDLAIRIICTLDVVYLYQLVLSLIFKLL